MNCNVFSEGPPRCSRGTGALALWEETGGAGFTWLGAERALGKASSSLSACGEVTEQTEAAHTLHVAGCRRHQGQDVTREVQAEDKEKLSLSEQPNSGQVAQRGCAVSILGDFPRHTWIKL